MPVTRIAVLPSMLDQHADEIKELGRKYGFHMAIDSLCGFCAMACALDLMLRDQDMKLRDEFPSEPTASPIPQPLPPPSQPNSAHRPTSSASRSAASSLPPSAASSISHLSSAMHPSTPASVHELPSTANAQSLIRLEDIFTWVQQRRIAYIKRHPEDFAPDLSLSSSSSSALPPPTSGPSPVPSTVSFAPSDSIAGTTAATTTTTTTAAATSTTSSPLPLSLYTQSTSLTVPDAAGAVSTERRARRDPRPTREAYLSMLVSTIEISEWISQLPLECGIALLCNIIEGPEVNAQSIRFPRSSFVSAEETEYLLKEQRFYSTIEPVDFFVISSGGQCLSLAQWGEELIKENRASPQLDFLILDHHGHYNVLRIQQRSDRWGRGGGGGGGRGGGGSIDGDGDGLTGGGMAEDEDSPMNGAESTEGGVHLELDILDSLPGAVDDEFYLESPQIRAVVSALGGFAKGRPTETIL